MIPIPDSIDELLPLREPTFWILVSLASGKKHGYAILREVETLSEGRIHLSAGTLYEALARLLDQDLIERTEDAAPDDLPRRGKPRKAYRLTVFGRRVLQAEMERLKTMAAAAKQLVKQGLFYESPD